MKFYVLDDNRAGNEPAVTTYLSADPVHRGEAPRCPVCNTFIGPLKWLPPYRVELEAYGSAWGDLVFPWGGDELLVSERFERLWKQDGLIGLSGFDSVEVVKTKKRRRLAPLPPGYLRVSLARSRALVDDAASGIRRDETRECPECGGGGLERIKRIVLKEGTWSGEDIFKARGLPGKNIASERFKEFCDHHQILNGLLIPVEDYQLDYS